MKTLTDLTGIYPLSKTLRFELKPIGKTLEHIERNGLIAQDEQRAEDYESVKKLIDKYHKEFISQSLSKCRLKVKSTDEYDSLEEYVEYAVKTNRTQEEENAFKKVKEMLRKATAESFKNDPDRFKELFKKEIITEHLPEMLRIDGSEEEIKKVESFASFTSYFTGFHQNRENMYSAEEKSTAIAYRLIHQNLPMFLDNIKSFEKIQASIDGKDLEEIENAFRECLNVEHIADMFQLAYFTEILTQEQIDVCNFIIGGKTEKDGTKIKGINEYVNLYNQQHKDNRLPLLKPLYKMILSDRTSLSWLPEQFKSDEEMLKAINEAVSKLANEVFNPSDSDNLQQLLSHISDYNTNHIYITNNHCLTDISQQIFGQYDRYTTAIKEEIKSSLKPTTKEKKDPDLLNDRTKKLFDARKSFSIAELNQYAQADDGQYIESYFSQMGAYARNDEQPISLLSRLNVAYNEAKDVLDGQYTNLNQSEEATKKIKNLLDAYKAIQFFVQPLSGSGDEAEKDNEFDAKLRNLTNTLDEVITPLYDKVRNWLTRKPYSTKKIKLNFESSTLLGGWVDSYTESSDNGTQYNGYLFRKRNQIGEYDFYLGISLNKKLFRRDNNLSLQGDMFERLDYYQIKSQTIFGKSYDGDYKKDVNAFFNTISSATKELSLNSSYNRRDENETLPAYIKRIKLQDPNIYTRLLENENVAIYYSQIKNKILKVLSSLTRVDCAQELAKHTDWELGQIYDGIFKMPSKSFSFFPVNNESIENAMSDKEKPLFLFKITNKDLSFAETFSKGLRASRGKDNLHTMYFKTMMSMVQNVYDLGTGEVFYRKKTEGLDETTAIHKAQSPINNKNKENKKQQSTFDYDIIKDRRYTMDKFQFHLSIIINYDKGKHENINSQVKEIIRNNGIKHIIGIDRGERHLLYLSLIDMKGNIVKQMTLNDIVNEYKGNTYSTNYKQLLEYREGERTEARRSWQTIENIKELKEGYLSQVVHVIAKMMVEYNAIVVLEDLNGGFVRGRQKIERNVYEQFEKKLIDKLNYYVDKQKDATEAGGVLQALQLTGKFESFQKLGKQSGCLFYIPAWNTSKIDPVTGFTNLLDTRYESVGKALQFFGKFDRIRYNKEKDWFEFVLDYDKFTTKAEGTQTRWTLCTYGTRIRSFRNDINKWDTGEVVLTEEFKQAFAAANIDINGNLKDAICGLNEKTHLEKLMHLVGLLVQLRNSKTNTEVDYMLSPVADEKGVFYDSRTCADTLPKDADANGAYNIARKGIWVIRKIQEGQTNDNVDLKITNKEWLAFAQQKPYLND